MKKTTHYLLLIAFLVTTNFISAQWTQRGSDINGESADDNSGNAVAISSDGTVVVIGAYKNDASGVDAGQVRVFENIGGVWVQKGTDIDGEAAGDWSGFSVSINGDGSIVAIGAQSNDGTATSAGHVRVFQFTAGNWQQMGSDIDGEASGDNSGYSIDLDESGLIIAVGAYGADANGNGSGQVKIYNYTAGNWTQKGSTINGEAGGDNSCIVSLNSNGTVLAIGAYFSSGNGLYSGSGRIFEFTAGDWAQIGDRIDGEAADDYFGMTSSISADGTIVAFGARNNDANGFFNSGHARVFENIGGVWVQKGSDIDGEATNDEAGTSISLSADGLKIAVGAKKNSGNGSNSGDVRIFEFKNNDWVLMGNPILGEAANDYSGCAVAMDAEGSNIAIGAYGNDDGGNTAGHVRVYYNCNTYSVLTMGECGTALTSPSGNYEWTTDGTYYDTIANNEFCDSMITIHLTFYSTAASVTQNSTVLTANTSGAEYQWVDCDNSYAAINGETGQSFTATQNGNFALVQTQFGCSDTSTCYSITTVGLDETYLNSTILTYMSSTTGHLVVKGDDIEKIELYDMQGKKIYASNFCDKEHEIDTKINQRGLYMILITTKKGIVSRKVVL